MTVRIVKIPLQCTSIGCSVCAFPVPKTLTQRTHRCPHCGTIMDRDYNAARNILKKAQTITAGTAGINAWGEAMYQYPSLNQGASSLNVK